MEFKRYMYIYNGEKHRDKKLIGYAQASAKQHKKYLEFDITKNELTPRQIATLAQGLNTPLHEMVDDTAAHSFDLTEYKNTSESELLTVLSHNPELLRTPILIDGEEYKFVDYIHDVNRQGSKGSASDSELFQQ